MRREEFFNQLEYLLQDIKEEEKRDAIDYYRDYLEEAGTDKEAEILESFGSPERIASIIRTDLLGGMEDGVEFTERGYEDRRFETSALPVVRNEERSDGPPPDKGGYENGKYADKDRVKKRGNNTLLQIILIAIIAIIGFPILVAAAAGVFSGAVGLGAVLFAFFIVFAVLTMVGFGCGIVIIIWGIGNLFIDVWFGILCVGIGSVFIGFGCLMLISSVGFYGKFLPWLVRGTADLIGRIFGRGKKKGSS